MTGILPAAVSLGLFDPAYKKDGQAALRAELLARGAKPEVIAEMLPREIDEQHLEVLSSFITEQFGIPREAFPTTKLDFERLFALTEAALLGLHGYLRAKGSQPHKASPEDVLDLQIKLVLCGTIIAAIRDVTCDYHDVLARWLKAGDTVISFNYDLLAERSLSRHSTWYPDDGYGVAFTGVGTRLAGDVQWHRPRRTRSLVRLLKPHGSLNWLYPRNSWDSVMNMSLNGTSVRQPSRQLYCLTDIYPNFEEDYPTYEWWEKYDIEEGGTMFDLHSLIVPPSLSKPYRDFEPYMGVVWGHATEALLERVTELYIIGYSLREDDVRTHWLLRKAAVESDTLKRVFLVDPSDDAVARAAKLFAPRRVERIAHTMESFATQLAQGAAR